MRVLVDVVCFLVELAMLALLTVSGWSLGDGGLIGIALAVLYPALAVVVWALFVARTAEKRLRQPWRLLLQLVLFAATTAATIAAGDRWLGIAFAVIAVVAFGLSAVLGESGAAAHAGPESPSS